jgi:hypothetical protein
MIRGALVMLFLLLGSSALAYDPEVEYFSKNKDKVEYEVKTLEMLDQRKMSIVVKKVDGSGEAVAEWKALDKGNDKGNGFLVDVPGNTILTVGPSIEAIHTDPAFAKPENPRTELSPLGGDKWHLEIYEGETVFFKRHSQRWAFTVWFYAD